MRLPIIVTAPTIIPSILGQSVPDCGRVGAVGVGVGLCEPVGVGVGVGVEVPQTQLALLVQLGFLQKPPEQTNSLLQFEFDPQVPLQLLGVPVGVGVGVGVIVGVPVGVGVGVPDPVGVGVGVVVVSVKEREQVLSAAFGKLDGTFGATGVCLN